MRSILLIVVTLFVSIACNSSIDLEPRKSSVGAKLTSSVALGEYLEQLWYYDTATSCDLAKIELMENFWRNFYKGYYFRIKLIEEFWLSADSRTDNLEGLKKEILTSLESVDGNNSFCKSIIAEMEETTFADFGDTDEFLSWLVRLNQEHMISYVGTFARPYLYCESWVGRADP